MLTANGEPVSVLDGEGHVVGVVTLGLIEQLLSEEARGTPHSTAGVGSSADLEQASEAGRR
jgi:hypothetical protein